MNAHLEHLLSKVYDESLAPEHLADLRRSALSMETITGQYIRSVPPTLIPKLLGFDLSGIRSALLFPFRSPGGGFMDHPRLKIFPPLVDAGGHQIKYLQPRGTSPRLYFIGACLREVIEGATPLWLVEGEKKVLAVAQLGLPAVGFCGVEGWHRRGEHRLLPDFDEIRLQNRVVEVVPDGDYQTNPNVRRGAERLGDALSARGARPRAVLLPSELPQ
jgi:hypothetical protein